MYINIFLDTALANQIKANSCNHRLLLTNIADQVADEDIYF